MNNPFDYQSPPPKEGSVVYVEETCRRGCCVERTYRATFRELAGNGAWICTCGAGKEQTEVLVCPLDVKKLERPGPYCIKRVAPRKYRTRASGSRSA